MFFVNDDSVCHGCGYQISEHHEELGVLIFTCKDDDCETDQHVYVDGCVPEELVVIPK